MVNLLNKCQYLVKPVCLKKIKLVKMMIFPGEEQEETITYKRSKRKAKREAVLSAFPSEEVHHELPIAHSYGSSSIIAHSIYQKYELKVPAYRQENDWQKLGLPIQRQDLINWQMKCSEYYFKPLYDLLRERLLKQKILHADETSYRVLESETIKTYYWTFLSCKQEKKPITLYHHDPHRSGKVAVDFLGDFLGIFTVICGKLISNYLKLH